MSVAAGAILDRRATAVTRPSNSRTGSSLLRWCSALAPQRLDHGPQVLVVGFEPRKLLGVAERRFLIAGIAAEADQRAECVAILGMLGETVLEHLERLL